MYFWFCICETKGVWHFFHVLNLSDGKVFVGDDDFSYTFDLPRKDLILKRIMSEKGDMLQVLSSSTVDNRESCLHEKRPFFAKFREEVNSVYSDILEKVSRKVPAD